MNGNGSGIVPTVDLATNNTNGFAYPVMPMYGGYGYGNSGFGFGGDGLWAILLIALLFGGFNGNGFGGWGGNNVATTDFVSSEFTQRDISQLSNTTTTGFGNLSTQLCNCCSDINGNLANGFYNTASNVANLRADVLENRYANQLAECNTQRDILTQTNELNTNLLTQALQNQAHIDACCCDIKSLIRQDGEETRALITNNTIQDLRDTIADKDRALQTATFNASQIDQTAALINTLAPRSIPAYITSSPYQSIYNPYGFGWNNGFYGNGFFGNTIV